MIITKQLSFQFFNDKLLSINCMDDHPQYQKIRNDAHKFYHSKGKVFSPALNEYIHFTSEGFNHIIFKRSRSERDKISQMARFKLLPRAMKLLELSVTFQEYEEVFKEVTVKCRKKNIRIHRHVKYWGIIAIIENRKIKVIVRKVGSNGTIKFWSIIPAWVTNKYRDEKFFTTMKGNPDED